MLGHVLLADDLPAAMAAANNNGHGTVYVTREGDVIWPGSMISGGSNADLPSEIDDHPLSVEEAQAALGEEPVGSSGGCHPSGGMPARARPWRLRLWREARRESANAERVVSERRAELARIERNNVVAQARREGARRRVGEIEAQIPAANARLGELALEERAAREQLVAFKEGLEARKVETEALGERMLQIASEVESRKAAP